MACPWCSILQVPKPLAPLSVLQKHLPYLLVGGRIICLNVPLFQSHHGKGEGENGLIS